MEITDYNKIIDFSMDITLKALDKNLIQTDINNPEQSAKNIAAFFNHISNELVDLS